MQGASDNRPERVPKEPPTKPGTVPSFAESTIVLVFLALLFLTGLGLFQLLAR